MFVQTQTQKIKHKLKKIKIKNNKNTKNPNIHKSIAFVVYKFRMALACIWSTMDCLIRYVERMPLCLHANTEN